jgi:hypothetical protein
MRLFPTCHEMLAGVTLGWQLPKAVFEPGNLAFGSPGHGTINQLAVEWLALEAGIKLMQRLQADRARAKSPEMHHFLTPDIG